MNVPRMKRYIMLQIRVLLFLLKIVRNDICYSKLRFSFFLLLFLFFSMFLFLLLGRELGLPEAFVGRHPFPGPGLAIRIPGEVTKEKCDILRKADAIYLDEIRKAGLYDTIWQAFAVLLPVKTVGVMGDGRTYDHVLALRAVTSVDGMTADFYPFDMNMLGRTATRIINEVKGINRVVYDVTSKPPGTIEWE